MARAARSESSRCGRTPPPNYVHGGRESTTPPTLQCSPTDTAQQCHARGCETGSTAPSRSPNVTAPPYEAGTSHRTHCATPPPLHLLQSGTDLATIGLWLGHSSPGVTHKYLEADLAAKEAVLQHVDDPSPAPARLQPDDQLLAFLQDL